MAQARHTLTTRHAAWARNHYDAIAFAVARGADRSRLMYAYGTHDPARRDLDCWRYIGTVAEVLATIKAALA